ncbi:hypothetical protein SKAU_G00384470 [Synaphobranchus kaupii]|uniref:Uncharacterized protein n=1 Tax=Synaphobranchus kaupii TaxID=118154 RepID=A0A9Q1EEB4_SYNKA|nr:hypothetical protein SKAU_G00384470 [Synaphobranchus kaupii]
MFAAPRRTSIAHASLLHELICDLGSQAKFPNLRFAARIALLDSAPSQPSPFLSALTMVHLQVMSTETDHSSGLMSARREDLRGGRRITAPARCPRDDARTGPGGPGESFVRNAKARQGCCALDMTSEGPRPCSR